MSKLTKLIKHPIRFFQDAGKSKKKPTTKKSTVKKAKSTFSSLIDIISISNVDMSHFEVALYFAGEMGNIYQVEQWIAPFKELNTKKPLVIIVRIKSVYDWLSANTDFIIVYCRTIENVIKFYEDNNFKCILYVNQGAKNFQSLINAKALHVHINHGESDKSSTITNQAKAYDYVCIVGDAAYDKYNLNLIQKDMKKFIKIGRPQLDHIQKIAPFNTEKKVVLYAPTWEGTHESMNFTSLNDYGMDIVQKLIDHPDYYLLYKPHPNTGSRDSKTKSINNTIINLLKESETGETIIGGDINSLYEHIDLAIFDNSAVAIDYLQINKPMLMTDMFHKIKDRQSKPTIVKAARMLDSSEIDNLPMIVYEELEHDTLHEIRNKIRYYFLGNYDYSQKESTQKFVNTVLDICNERDNLLENLKTMNNIAETIQ